jgi:hypothetical protein
LTGISAAELRSGLITIRLLPDRFQAADALNGIPQPDLRSLKPIKVSPVLAQIADTAC